MKFIKKYQHLIIACLLLLIISFVYLYKIVPFYNYDSDFGRDITAIQKITQGDLTLLGPKTSFGGLYTGPYYYYLFTPIIALFPQHPENVLYFNVFLFVISFALITLAIYKKYTLNSKSLLPLLWLFTSPIIIYSARNPGNAFSYIPLLILVLFLIPWIIKQKNIFLWIIYGFFCGLVLNIHVVNTLIFFPLVFILAYYKKSFLPFLIFVGILISLSPSALFEVTHNFVQIRNTFIDKSYLSFISNTNIPNSLPTSANPIINFWLLLKNSSTWAGISFIFLFITNIVLYLFKKSANNQNIKTIFKLSLFSFLIVSIVGRSQMTFFYLFPFILLTQITFIFLISKYKFSKLFIIILLIGNIVYFPKNIYTTPPRLISEFKSFTTSLTQSDFWKKVDTKNYNLYVARETAMAPQGWEYRYFLNLNGYKILAPTLFNQANQLLIIQEHSNTENVINIKSWEIDQFGPKSLIQSIELDGRKIFLFDKKLPSTPKLKTR